MVVLASAVALALASCGGGRSGLDGGVDDAPCPSGFTGPDCTTNIADCADQPCQHGGVCTDGVDDYTCACPPGYAGDDCQLDVDECAAGPCLNGGVCTDGVNGFSCACAPEFMGPTCAIEIPAPAPVSGFPVANLVVGGYFFFVDGAYRPMLAAYR